MTGLRLQRHQVQEGETEKRELLLALQASGSLQHQSTNRSRIENLKADISIFCDDWVRSKSPIQEKEL